MSKECEEARENPGCPYVTKINQTFDKITEVSVRTKRIDKALMGEDGTSLYSGVIFELNLLKQQEKINKSWVNAAKILVSTVITVAVTVIVTGIATGAIHL